MTVKKKGPRGGLGAGWLVPMGRVDRASGKRERADFVSERRGRVVQPAPGTRLDWTGKAPRPELMPGGRRGGVGQAAGGRGFWVGKAPRPDLMIYDGATVASGPVVRSGHNSFLEISMRSQGRQGADSAQLMDSGNSFNKQNTGKMEIEFENADAGKVLGGKMNEEKIRRQKTQPLFNFNFDMSGDGSGYNEKALKQLYGIGSRYTEEKVYAHEEDSLNHDAVLQLESKYYAARYGLELLYDVYYGYKLPTRVKRHKISKKLLQDGYDKFKSWRTLWRINDLTALCGRFDLAYFEDPAQYENYTSTMGGIKQHFIALADNPLNIYNGDAETNSQVRTDVDWHFANDPFGLSIFSAEGETTRKTSSKFIDTYGNQGVRPKLSPMSKNISELEMDVKRYVTGNTKQGTEEFKKLQNGAVRHYDVLLDYMKNREYDDKTYDEFKKALRARRDNTKDGHRTWKKHLKRLRYNRGNGADYRTGVGTTGPGLIWKGPPGSGAPARKKATSHTAGEEITNSDNRTTGQPDRG